MNQGFSRRIRPTVCDHRPAHGIGITDQHFGFSPQVISHHAAASAVFIFENGIEVGELLINTDIFSKRGIGGENFVKRFDFFIKLNECATSVLIE